MKFEEALAVLRKLCESFSGNWQEHTTLQEALRVVKDGRKAELDKSGE